MLREDGDRGISHRLCRILRYKLEERGLAANSDGFVSLRDLMTQFSRYNQEDVRRVAVNSIGRDDRPRFEVLDDPTDGCLIRVCRQFGHRRRSRVQQWLSEHAQVPATQSLQAKASAEDDDIPTPPFNAFPVRTYQELDRAYSRCMQKHPLLIVSCGLDTRRGSMCHIALRDVLNHIREFTDIDAFPSLGACQLPFLCEVAEFFGGRRRDHSRRMDESVEAIYAQLVEKYTHVSMTKLNGWLAEYVELTGFLLIGCRSGNHRSRAIAYSTGRDVASAGRPLIIIHLSALFPSWCSLSKEIRSKYYCQIGDLVQKAVCPFICNYAYIASDQWFRAVCTDPCVICQTTFGCVKRGLHCAHICDACSEYYCLHDCAAAPWKCGQMCSRGHRAHEIHLCEVCNVPCERSCDTCGHACIRKQPDHDEHWCAKHTKERIF